MKEYYIGINGIIETDLSHQEFLDKFILWIEDNNYRFFGLTKEVDEEGDPVENNKKFIDVE